MEVAWTLTPLSDLTFFALTHPQTYLLPLRAALLVYCFRVLKCSYLEGRQTSLFRTLTPFSVPMLFSTLRLLPSPYTYLHSLRLHLPTSLMQTSFPVQVIQTNTFQPLLSFLLTLSAPPLTSNLPVIPAEYFLVDFFNCYF